MEPCSDHDRGEAGCVPIARRRWRAGTLAVLGLSVTALLGATSAVVASSPAVTRSIDGTPGVDLRKVTGMYQGQVVDLDAVQFLNEDDKAQVSVASHELGCQGVMLYFDTEAQADHYGRGYLERLEASKDAPREPTGDPCADTADAPRFDQAR